MDRSYQTKHIYLAVSVIIAVFAPILYFFLPQTVADIVHHKDEVFFVSVPQENFYTFGVGFVFLFISSMILFLFDIRKLSVIFSILFLCIAFATFFVGSQSYRTLAQDNITSSSLFSFEKEIYTWDQVTQVIHHRNEMGDISIYEFVFDDGNSIRLKDTRYFRHISYQFNKKLAEENLSIDFALIEE
jgi:ABC-type multidrug transport system fused ATPase/permease subunit